MSDTLTFTERPEACPACGADFTSLYLMETFAEYGCGLRLLRQPISGRWQVDDDCQLAFTAAVRLRAERDEAYETARRDNERLARVLAGYEQLQAELERLRAALRGVLDYSSMDADEWQRKHGDIGWDEIRDIAAAALAGAAETE